MSLYIFDGLIYHQRTLRVLENHSCSFSIINVQGPLVNLIYFMYYPWQQNIQIKVQQLKISFLLALIVIICDKNLEILLRSCNSKFTFLNTVLSCSVKSTLLSIKTPTGFQETLFFLHLRSDSHLSKKNCFIFFNKSPSKMMKNAFYFVLKAPFVLKILNFCLNFLDIQKKPLVSKDKDNF